MKHTRIFGYGKRASYRFWFW